MSDTRAAPSIDNVEITIPTRDSEIRTGAFADAWRRLGLSPLYVVDSRTRDGTRNVLARRGMRYVEVTPEHNRVEDMIWRVGEDLSRDWLLRFDDDEFPSVEMIAWIAAKAGRIEAPAVYFSRRWCLPGPASLCYATGPTFAWRSDRPTHLDPQLRLFRPRDVIWTADIHTPGIRVTQEEFAPADAFFCHFDWMVRTLAQRKAKIAEYDRQHPAAGSACVDFYLPEETTKDLALKPFETGQFDDLASDIRMGHWPAIWQRALRSVRTIGRRGATAGDISSRP